MTGTDEPKQPDESRAPEPAAPEPQQPSAPEPEAEPEAEPEPEPEPVGWLPQSAPALFGAGATAEEAYGLLTVDVPAAAWISALETARDTLGCTYFDWLSAVDEPDTGFRVCAHVVAVPTGTGGGPVHRLIVRTTVPHVDATLPTCTGVYAGAGWHERETHEMFGVGFTGHPHLEPLLLPEGFEGHPLRKDFVLAARVAKAWPGAKEPGESGHGGPKRRQMLPPGVPDPNEWGPLKGQLPPVPSRPARGRAASGDRPARRRAKAAPEAEASGTETTEAAEAAEAAGAETPEQPAAPAKRTPRRNRSASAGSVSQQAAAQEPTAEQEPAQAQPAPEPEQARPAQKPAQKPGEQPEQAAPGTRSADAPWHHARPAFEPEATPEPEAQAKAEPAPESEPAPAPESEATPDPGSRPGPRAGSGTDSSSETGGEAREETEGDA